MPRTPRVFLLSDVLEKARRATHAELTTAGQTSMFGGSTLTPKGKVKPKVKGAKTGKGTKHGVKAHMRRTKTGLSIVHEHQRTGLGHQEKEKPEERQEPEEKPETSAEPELDLFRMGQTDLLEHAAAGHEGARGELHRRNANRKKKGKKLIPTPWDEKKPKPRLVVKDEKPAPKPEPEPAPEPAEDATSAAAQEIQKRKDEADTAYTEGIEYAIERGIAGDEVGQRSGELEAGRARITLKNHGDERPDPMEAIKEGISAGKAKAKPPEKKPRKAPRTTTKKHEEVGIHTEMSRADTAKPTGPRGPNLDYDSKVTKDMVLQKPDREEDRAAGYSPGGHHLRAYLYRMVGTKPMAGRSKRWRRQIAPILKGTTEATQRGAFHMSATYFDKMLSGLKTAQDATTAITELRDLCAAEYVSDKLYPEGGSFSGADPQKDDAMDGLLQAHPGLNRADVRHVSIRTEYKDETTAERKARRAEGRSKEKAGTRYSFVDDKQRKMWETKMVMLGEQIHKTMVDKNTSDGLIKAIVEAKKLDDLGWSGADSDRNAAKKARTAAFGWADIRGEAAMRTGGRSIGEPDGAQMANDHALKNIQYGKNMSNADKEMHLRLGHQSCHDLADMLEVPPDIIGMKGRLTIAFGARGSGNRGWQGAAAAHYESDLKAINITHKAGGGSLAHEWGHFMDDMLSGGKGAYTSKGGDTHPELKTAMTGVLHAMMGESGHQHAQETQKRTLRVAEAVAAHNDALKVYNAKIDAGEAPTYAERRDMATLKRGVQTAKRRAESHARGARLGVTGASRFLRDAMELDSKKAYWATPHEMFARAFESYVQDKLHSNQRKNTYLVQGTDRPVFTGVSAKRDPAHIKAEQAASNAKANAHPTVVSSSNRWKAANAKFASEQGRLIKKHWPRAKQNRWGAWSDTMKSRAEGLPEIKAIRAEMRTSAKAHREAYQAQHVPAREHVEAEGLLQYAQPYPHGEERTKIYAAMDNFLKVARSTGALRKALESAAITSAVRLMAKSGPINKSGLALLPSKNNPRVKRWQKPTPTTHTSSKVGSDPKNQRFGWKLYPHPPERRGHTIVYRAGGTNTISPKAGRFAAEEPHVALNFAQWASSDATMAAHYVPNNRVLDMHSGMTRKDMRNLADYLADDERDSDEWMARWDGKEASGVDDALSNDAEARSKVAEDYEWMRFTEREPLGEVSYMYLGDSTLTGAVVAQEMSKDARRAEASRLAAKHWPNPARIMQFYDSETFSGPALDAVREQAQELEEDEYDAYEEETGDYSDYEYQLTAYDVNFRDMEMAFEEVWESMTSMTKAITEAVRIIRSPNPRRHRLLARLPR